jgi:hypothetical protein
VNRGGSFNDAASNARSANRNDNTPENQNTNLGLRPAKASRDPIAVDRSAAQCTVMPRSASRAAGRSLAAESAGPLRTERIGWVEIKEIHRRRGLPCPQPLATVPVA